VKHLLWYLKGTADKRIIFKASGKFLLNNYVDADFAGLHGSEPESDSNSAHSRMGYIIFLSDCSLYWKTALISEITGSTLHSKYIGLSSSLRIQLVMRHILEELAEGLHLYSEISGSIVCRAFKDNQGALLLANNQCLSNRTCHFNVK